jgi:predicted TIM-barrel fold metal-dependent hydrolase
MHAYNLSHPSLILFINRFLNNNEITFHQILSGNLFQCLNRIIFKEHSLLKKLLVFLILVVLVFIIIQVSFFINQALNQILITLITSLALIVIMYVGLAVIMRVSVNRFLNYKKLNRATNLFSIFENNISRQFRYIELDYMSLNEDIKVKIKSFNSDISGNEMNEKLMPLWEQYNKCFEINNVKYSKVLITPLVMDFGFKGFSDKDAIKDIYYHLRPSKAVVHQTRDLFAGIQEYYGSSKKDIENGIASAFQLLEIYPFLGINTRNYQDDVKIKHLLNKYFGDFSNNDTKEIRMKKLEEKRLKFLNFSRNYREHGKGKFPENENSIRMIMNSSLYYFAGIKLYPPMGFNPWPVKEDYSQEELDAMNLDMELKKVSALYDFCIEHGIPITTHCSDGGFEVVDINKQRKFTTPEKWLSVLGQKKDLKLNLAHSGIQTRKYKKVFWGEWFNKIIGMIASENDAYPNLYIDLSDIGAKNCSYGSFSNAIRNYNEKLMSTDRAKFLSKVNKRILFGTDFMVNLFSFDSYLDNLIAFSVDKSFDKIGLAKDDFCTLNSERFLYGN